MKRSITINSVVIVRTVITLFFLAGAVSCAVGLFINGWRTHWHLLYLAVIYLWLAFAEGRLLILSLGEEERESGQTASGRGESSHSSSPSRVSPQSRSENTASSQSYRKP